MSYDLYMLAPEEGVEPYEQLERLDEEELSTAPDPAIEQRKRRIVDALRQADPRYEESVLNHDVIAAQKGISVEEARARHRSIQLTAEGGLEINLYDHHADFNFPYWDSLDAEALTADIERAAGIIAAETGWTLYDPQLERIIDPSADAGDVRGMFDYGREKLQEDRRCRRRPPWFLQAAVEAPARTGVAPARLRCDPGVEVVLLHRAALAEQSRAEGAYAHPMRCLAAGQRSTSCAASMLTR